MVYCSHGALVVWFELELQIELDLHRLTVRINASSNRIEADISIIKWRLDSNQTEKTDLSPSASGLGHKLGPFCNRRWCAGQIGNE